MMWGKKLISCMMAIVLVMTMVLAVPGLEMEAAGTEVTYAVTGGNITFDTSTGTITGCDWEVTEAIIPNKIEGVSVTSIGWGAFLNCSNLRNIKIPTSVKEINFRAFESCVSLSNIEMPESITSIESRAFFDCSSLRSIEIPISVMSIGDVAFYNCSSLVSIEIPAGVTSIGENAFSSCSSLRSIDVDQNNTAYSSVEGILFNKDQTVLLRYPEGKAQTVYQIPEGVTDIADSTFSHCTSLSNVEIPVGATYIGEFAFSGCNSLSNVEIPEGVTNIREYTFYMCSNLKSIEIPDGVTSIEESAFSDCTSLKSVEIPVGVTYIGYSAFSECISLNNILLPTSVKNIREYAFLNCNSLENIEIPANVTSIEESAFSGCTSLRSVEIPAGVAYIGDSVFYECNSLNSINVDKNNTAYSSVDGVLFNKDQTTLICYPAGKTQTVYQIPKEVTDIADKGFAYCDSLHNVEIPIGVIDIGYGVFAYCNELNNIKIPKSVTSIGYSAFEQCNNLSSIEIPISVTSIKDWAFEYCDSLKDVYYGGSEEDWKNIIIGVYNTDLRDATIHYNSTGSGDIGDNPGDNPDNPPSSDKTTVTGDNTEESEVEWSVGGNVEFGVPEDIPLIGGGDISLDFGEIPVQFEREGNTFRIGVGVNSLEDLDEKGWTTFKKFVETQRESYRKACKLSLNSKSGIASMGMEVKPDISFFAYAEGTITKDGIQSFGGKSFIEIKAKAEQQWQTTVVVVPVVVKFSGEAGVAVTNSIGLDLANSSVYTTGKVDLTLPELRLSAGVGVAYIADISVYGSGKNVLTAEIEAPDNEAPKGKFTGTLSGELGISATALFFSYEKALLEGDWEYYSSEKAKVRSKSIPYGVIDEDQWKIERVDSSAWNGAKVSRKKSKAKAANAGESESIVQVLQSDVYTSAKPTLLKTDSGKKVMIYTSDIPDRSTGNHTAVVYSVYDEDNSSWTEPVLIEDDGTADFDAVAAVEGENVYIVWSDAKKTFTETEAMSENFEEAMASACEITVAKLDLEEAAGENVTIYPVTNNEYADLKPAVMVNNSVPYISWYENQNNDILEGKGTNIVHMAALEENAFVLRTFHKTDTPVQSVAIGVIENNVMAAWECSSGIEESLETTISVMDLQGEVTEIIDNSQNHKPSFDRINGQEVLLWYAEDSNGAASLQYVDTPEGEIHTYLKNDAVITSDYKVIEGEDCELVVCASNKVNTDEDGRNLYAYVIRNGQISEPVTLTNMDGYAADPSGIWNGTDFEFLFARTDAVFNDGLETKTDLCFTSVFPQSKLEMGTIEYTEEDMMPGEAAVLTVPVTNNGLESTGTNDKVQVLYGTDVIGETVLNQEMEPGQTNQVEITASMPADLPEKAELTVQTVSEEGSNETQQITSGSVELDVAVEQPDMDTFSVTASNTSGYDTSASLLIKTETGDTLRTVDLGNIAANGQITQSFTREELAGLGSDTLNIEVTSGEQDLLPFNNTAFVYVGEDTLKTLDHLVASKMKVEYKKGETLNLDDLEIKAVYTDGSEATVSDYTTNITDIDMTVPGEKDLIITYEEVYRTRKVNMPITVMNTSEDKPEEPDTPGSGHQTEPDKGNNQTIPGASSGQNTGQNAAQTDKTYRPIKVTSMRLSAPSNKIAAGKRIKLTANILPVNASDQRLIWSSSNPKVATVNQSGVVTMKKKTGGKSVIITARAADGSGATAAFRIKSMKGVVKKVTIAGAKKRTVKAGQKLKLKAKVAATKGANKKLIWTSSNTKYATVSASGKVKTKKLGRGKKVKITAMATDGSNKKMTVTIKLK